MDILRLNWEVTLAFCERLAAEAKAYHPDLIVGLSRGGLVPGAILSDILDVREIGILGVTFYKGIGKRAQRPMITQELTMELGGRKILLWMISRTQGRAWRQRITWRRRGPAKCGSRDIVQADIRIKRTIS